ncbi:MAG: transposon-encoded TnpW family protein [Clostridiales bacterium]|nr:transposon-encoded TnpW family protein [Clostridiales bacterium]
MTALNTERTTEATISTAAHSGEAGSFTKRIGSTTYRVGIYFSETSKETAMDKIARLVRLESYQ